MPAAPSPSVMSEEIARFDAIGEAWWDADGPMAPLHRLNPIRIGWARDLIVRHFKLEAPAGLPLKGVDLLDIGCGAGLFAEPLARLGAEVVGVDPAPAAIEVARAHAEETGARLAYRAATVEELAKEERRFDVVSAMEVIEHAADPKAFVAMAASLVKPGGLLLASTLNRTLKSFALAIVGAEICAALARARNPPLGAIRDAARAHRLRPRRGLKTAQPARHGLRSVPARLAAVLGSRRELPLRRDEGGPVDSQLNRLYASDRFRRRAAGVEMAPQRLVST